MEESSPNQRVEEERRLKEARGTKIKRTRETGDAKST